MSRLQPLFLAGASWLLLSISQLPAASVAVAPFPQNLSAKGPPLPATPPAEPTHPAPIPLWPEGAPGSAARRTEPEQISWRQEPDIVFPVISNIHAPSLTPFLPAAGRATGCAVIIAPGGGHMQLTIDREGYDLARWLADRGIAAFVLKYRLARDTSTPRGTPQPYKVDDHAAADTRRAVRLLRARASEFNLKADHIGVLGFSAGGELALIAGSQPDPTTATSPDPLDATSARPDFIVPVYPGGLERADVRSPASTTPPVFLVCAFDDRMPEPMAAYFAALHKAGVNAELHIYNRGGHGFGVRSDRPDYAVSSWPARLVDWLGDRGFLK